MISLSFIPINLYPQTRLPTLTITTELADSSPEEIETLISRKMEEALVGLPGLRKISSSSRQGTSRLVLEFQEDRDLSESVMEVRGRIRRLWPSFPKDTRFPIINHYNPSDEPLVVMGITGAMSLHELSHWVEHTLKPQFSRIKGVAAVQAAGSSFLEMKVNCDAGMLNAQSLSVHDVAEAIKKGNAALHAGFITEGGKRFPIRTAGDLRSVPDVANQPVVVGEGGAVVTVGDVAEVEMVSEAPREISRLNGKPLVSLALYRTTDSDMRRIWLLIQEKIDELNKMETRIRIEVIYNQAEILEESLARLKVIMLLAALTAGGTLFLFLGTVSSTLIILAAIPFSMLVALLLMQIFGLSLDLFSLSGLSLSVGTVVDSGIIVIESISFRMGYGRDPKAAIVAGTEEISLPVLFSTITTISVFLPLLFVSQRVRSYFVGLTWSVSLSMLASLIAAMVLVPVLFGFFGGRRGNRFDLSKYVDYPRHYDRVLSFVVSHPRHVVLATMVFLTVVGFMATRLTYRQDWGIAEQGFKVNLVMTPGTSADRTLKEAQTLENRILKLPKVRRVYTRITEDQGRIMVTLNKNSTSADAEECVKTMRQSVPQQPHAEYYFMPLGQGGNLRTLTVIITGPSVDRMVRYMHEARSTLMTLPGVQTCALHQANPAPEVGFKVEYDRLGSKGVRPANMAMDLRSRLTGPVATRIAIGEEEIPVRVKTKQDPRVGLKPLQQAYLLNDQSDMLPFTELTEPSLNMVQREINRENRIRAVTASVVLSPEADPVQVAAAIQASLAKIRLDPGYTFKMGEEVEEILRTKREMLGTAFIGLLLIYLVLVAGTESFLQPLVIMTAAPFAAGGVILALTLSGYSVNLPVYMGTIILCGLLANVNIVLVYAIKDRLAAGAAARDAVIEGARRRLRPILMTTMTSVCASLPMLFDRGIGSSTWVPFALTLASGLTASAMFSLVLTPAAYLELIGIEERFRRVAAVIRSRLFES
jgi:HAE1 family hydrophobic/amphiphilic exporter-1